MGTILNRTRLFFIVSFLAKALQIPLAVGKSQSNSLCAELIWPKGYPCDEITVQIQETIRNLHILRVLVRKRVYSRDNWNVFSAPAWAVAWESEVHFLPIVYMWSRLKLQMDFCWVCSIFPSVWQARATFQALQFCWFTVWLRWDLAALNWNPWIWEIMSRPECVIMSYSINILKCVLLNFKTLIMLRAIELWADSDICYHCTGWRQLRGERSEGGLSTHFSGCGIRRLHWEQSKHPLEPWKLKV